MLNISLKNFLCQILLNELIFSRNFAQLQNKQRFTYCGLSIHVRISVAKKALVNSYLQSKRFFSGVIVA